MPPHRLPFTINLPTRLRAIEREVADATEDGCGVCKAWPVLLQREETSPWEEHARCPSCGYDPGWPRCPVVDLFDAAETDAR